MEELPGSLTITDDGVVCAGCHEPIPVGEDAIVAMYGAIDETLQTKEPQVMTFDYAGVYHPHHFTDTETDVDRDEAPHSYK